jgi:hypothetical protein
LIRLRPNTYKDDIETVSICSIEFLASNLIWAIVLGLAPKTELRALLTAHPGQERDAAEHLINACCEIGLSQLETCYPLFRGARIGSLRKKNAIAFELELLFRRELGDSRGRLSQTSQRYDALDNGAIAGDSLGQFRVDGLQMLSFAIIKIDGVRDLIRLRQEECQFIGTAI